MCYKCWFDIMRDCIVYEWTIPFGASGRPTIGFITSKSEIK